MKKILVIDDEKEMLESFKKILSYREDYHIKLLSNPGDALKLLAKEKFDMVLTDLKMGEISGMDVLSASLKYNPGCLVILISGYGTIESSVEAVKMGAFDFIEKPFNSKKLFETIDRGFALREEKMGMSHEEPEEFKSIIHNSKKMKNVLDLVKKIAPSNMNVLIIGESGTGKELIARAVHSLSSGKNSPFVPVNCGALPESLFESELFGHEKGAFTGAVKTKPGLLEFAKDGTFFFDEIAEMSPALQVKLLRMLEEHKIRRIGGQTEIEINVRIIAATNKDLEALIDKKLFREDLYYRLNNFKIDIPPLRERQDDIIPLANAFMAQLCSGNNEVQKRFSPEAQEALKKYSWPGNVREVQNLLNKIFYLCPKEIIELVDLPLPISRINEMANEALFGEMYKEAKEKLIEKFDVEYLSYHLKKNNGNITKTSEACGLDRRSIHRLILKYNLIYKD